jgi:hypothetical protein
MRLYLTLCAVFVACTHAPVGTNHPLPAVPALILDGTVLSCHVENVPVPDTGCAALAFMPVKDVSFLDATEAVRYFGPAAQHGAYVARTPALDLTPLLTTARVVPVAIIVNGRRSVCLMWQSRDPRVIDRRPRGPVFPCPVLDALAPDEITDVELVKSPRSITLFGRAAAAYALIVTLRP